MAKKEITKPVKAVKPKDEKHEAGVLQTRLVSPAQAELLTKFPYASPIKIEDEDLLIRECEKEIEYMVQLRTERGLVEKWQKARDQYAGVIEDKDFPWDDCSNLHIHITAMTVDVLNTKAQAQMFVSPMMVLKPLPGQISGESSDLYADVDLKERFLDYKVQEEIGIEEKLDPVYQDAINIGTGIAKVSYLRKIDFDSTVSQMYASTKKDIRNFKLDFEKDKESDVYKQYLKYLIGSGTEESPVGIPVEVWMQSDEIVYDNPEISYVKLDDLMIRPDIQNIEDQRVIGENVKFTWLELCNRFEQGFFTNENILNHLREKHSENNEYAKKIYDAREVICFYDYEKSNKPKRVVITYLTEEKKMLRAITFPYQHRKPYYVFYYIKRVPGSAYGEGMAKRLENTNKGLNILWNQVVDAGTLRNAPAFKAVKGASFNPEIKKWGPAVIWWLGAMNEAEAFPIYGMSAEMLGLIGKLERYGEWQTGVSAYASGRESPSDPNAPASKAYLLLKESNLRLNKMIRQLHKGNKEVIEMVDKLIYQYTKRDQVPFVIGKGEQFDVQPITKKILGLKVNYIPQLSDITENKETQKENDMRFGQYLMPILASVPTSQREILKIQIRNQGGAWVKAMDRLLPPEVKGPEKIPATILPGRPGSIPIPNLAAGVPGVI